MPDNRTIKSSTERDPAGKKIKRTRAGVELSFLQIITIDVTIKENCLDLF